MIEAPLYSATGEKRKQAFALPAEYFDGTVNQAVLHQSVRAYRNNQRQGTHQTKTRAMVSGGSEKPWRQKGTGRARQGTIRAAQWRGGGVVFGPSPRDYTTPVPRKVRHLARRSALNARAAEGAIAIVEGWEFESPKTADFVTLLERWGAADRKVLALTNGLNRPVYLSARNLQTVEVMPYAEATAYHLLWADVVVVEQAALPTGGEVVEASAKPASPKKAVKKKSTAKATGKAAKRASAKKKKTTAKRTTAKTKTVKKTTAKKAAKKTGATKKKKKKGSS
jgi:large subunit ribosomal protein L4